MIPQPVEAMIFLFPLTAAYEKFKDEEEAILTKCEQSISPDVVFFKQTISNACGMMALLHSVASNDDEIVGKACDTEKIYFNMILILLLRSWLI